MKNALTLTHVYKRFKDERRKNIEVLENINLTVREGEFFVILGPSGAGKSTLVRLMSRLDVPSSGEVIYGTDLSAKDVGFVFQQFALLPWLTVFQIIRTSRSCRCGPRFMTRTIRRKAICQAVNWKCFM